MSGHSKWATIRRKKSALDQKKGREFSKAIRAITVSAREAGGDPAVNAGLRMLIDKAKASNMPNDTIERAVKRGAGELEGVNFVETTYEGYGPNGVAVFIETLTDNKNRTTAEVRHILAKHGGQLGENGCVSWMFHKKGMLLVDTSKIDEDKLMEIALESGAEEMQEDGAFFKITTAPQAFDAVKKAVEGAGIALESAEITMEPQTYVKLEGKQAESIMRIMNMLEDLDDVQNVYANFDIPEDVMEKMA